MKKTIYVIFYENPNILKGKPKRGIIDIAFEDQDEALVQAAKAEKNYPGVKHWVQSVPLYTPIPFNL